MEILEKLAKSKFRSRFRLRTKELFYYGDWIRKPGVAICSCNDGLRPVIFKIEAEE